MFYEPYLQYSQYASLSSCEGRGNRYFRSNRLGRFAIPGSSLSTIQGVMLIRAIGLGLLGSSGAT